jgi:hypothetical protein
MFNFEHTYLTNINKHIKSSIIFKKLTHMLIWTITTIVDELSLVSVRMLNIINHWLRTIKHIQNQIFGGLNVIMSSEFHSAFIVKNYWIFPLMIVLMH